MMQNPFSRLPGGPGEMPLESPLGPDVGPPPGMGTPPGPGLGPPPMMNPVPPQMGPPMQPPPPPAPPPITEEEEFMYTPEEPVHLSSPIETTDVMSPTLDMWSLYTSEESFRKSLRELLSRHYLEEEMMKRGNNQL